MQEYRIESDLLGELQVPADAYYGVQTQRALENFKISTDHLCDHPDFINGLAYVKKAAAKTNYKLGLLSEELYQNIAKACDELLAGKMHDQFPVDMIQGGAGTSVNMNANEVIANRALELMGHKRGEYIYCSPNDHVNMSQSTNDAFPTAIKIALLNMNRRLIDHLKSLVEAFRSKANELHDVL
ncbi:MAG: aspartate ammonia-lyase, partial [Chryseobacterium sp.]